MGRENIYNLGNLTKKILPMYLYCLRVWRPWLWKLLMGIIICIFTTIRHNCIQKRFRLFLLYGMIHHQALEVVLSQTWFILWRIVASISNRGCFTTRVVDRERCFVEFLPLFDVIRQGIAWQLWCLFRRAPGAFWCNQLQVAVICKV